MCGVDLRSRKIDISKSRIGVDDEMQQVEEVK